MVTLLLLLIGLTLPIFKKNHCFECGLDFKASKTKDK